jgi:hypothetical protein
MILGIKTPTPYQRPSGLVLGFHGCDREVGEKVLSGDVPHLAMSKNDYDWLGEGIYFWENDPQRALEFAIEAKRNTKITKGKIKEPFVVGAIIDLGVCLNFLERQALDELKMAHAFMKATFKPTAGKSFPTNGKDRGARNLDSAAITMVHSLRKSISSPQNPLPEYCSVKGAFWEGGELYPGAGFDAKNHIQIAVRKPEICIKGYFRPIL